MASAKEGILSWDTTDKAQEMMGLDRYQRIRTIPASRGRTL